MHRSITTHALSGLHVPIAASLYHHPTCFLCRLFATQSSLVRFCTQVVVLGGFCGFADVGLVWSADCVWGSWQLIAWRCAPGDA